jgi:hypothetical protein
MDPDTVIKPISLIKQAVQHGALLSGLLPSYMLMTAQAKNLQSYLHAAAGHSRIYFAVTPNATAGHGRAKQAIHASCLPNPDAIAGQTGPE